MMATTDRSVANLTTEQLYRKRAFDRENQRASRARKKTRIAELEDEVADLKRRLAHAQDQAEQSKSSEAALREAIDSARSSLQRVDASASRQISNPSPPPSTRASGSVDEEFATVLPLSSSPPINFVGYVQDQETESTTMDFRNGVQPQTTTTSTDSGDDSMLGHGNFDLTLGLPLAPNFDTMSYFWENVFPTGPSSPMSFQFLDPFPTDWNETSWASPLEDETPPNQRLMRQWERIPPHLDASCRLDTVFLELFRTSRQRAVKIPEFSAPAFPSIGSLLNPESESSYSPISNAIGVHGRVTMAMPSLEKIAIMYNMCIYLRWLITPTKENYEAMPEHLRPLEIQLTIPHPVWIDIFVWPAARERIIRHMDWSEFEILRAIGNHDISIHWPHGLSTVFTSSPSEGMRMNPKFEKHIRCLDNWSMGDKVQARFPFLKGVTGTMKTGTVGDNWEIFRHI